MSTRRITNSIFILCLFGIFVSNALSASPETMLIGKWKYFRGKEIEFVKDGTLIIGDQGAKYRVIERERIEFDLGMVAMFSDFGGPRPVFRFTVSNDELTLIPLAIPNEPQKLRRVRVDGSGNDQYTYWARGNSNLRKDPQQTIKDYDKGIELDPKFATLYMFRGIAYSNLSNHHEAIKNFNRAIELNPKDAAAYSNRGYAHSRLGNYQQGVKDIEHSIDLSPNYIWSYYHMACVFSIQNNADLACKWLKKAIEKGYKDWKHLKED
jgi:tetratricopeptide (TPR) repeat protein